LRPSTCLGTPATGARHTATKGLAATGRTAEGGWRAGEGPGSAWLHRAQTARLPGVDRWTSIAASQEPLFGWAVPPGPCRGSVLVWPPGTARGPRPGSWASRDEPPARPPPRGATPHPTDADGHGHGGGPMRRATERWRPRHLA